MGSLYHGVVRKGTQIWIGDNLALRTKLIATMHDSALGGHSGIQATHHRVKKIMFY